MTDDLELHDSPPVLQEDPQMEAELAQFALKHLEKAHAARDWEKVSKCIEILTTALKRPRAARKAKQLAHGGRGQASTAAQTPQSNP